MAVSLIGSGPTQRGKLHVWLIKPSRYDDEGFVLRHWRGVLPSNTLACLNGLTEDIRQRRGLGDVDLRVHLVDEAVMPFRVEQLVSVSHSPTSRSWPHWLAFRPINSPVPRISLSPYAARRFQY